MEEIITHHGIKGMRWGIRRYQNEDGSLTPAGKKRYSSDESDSEKKESTLSRALDPTVKTGKDKAPISIVEKTMKEAGNITTNTSAVLDSVNRIKNAGKSKDSAAKSMSDQELRDIINRIELERRYDSLSQPEMSKGKTYVNETLKTIGSITSIVGSVAAIASTIKQLMKT